MPEDVNSGETFGIMNPALLQGELQEDHSSMEDEYHSVDQMMDALILRRIDNLEIVRTTNACTQTVEAVTTISQHQPCQMISTNSVIF
jgi:hypothetical protein